MRATAAIRSDPLRARTICGGGWRRYCRTAGTLANRLGQQAIGGQDPRAHRQVGQPGDRGAAARPNTTSGWGRLTSSKHRLTVSNDLRFVIGGACRSHPPPGIRAAQVGAQGGRRHRARHAGEPSGGVAAPEGLEGGGSRGGPARGRAPRLLHRSAGTRRVARMARSVLGSGAGGVPGRSGNGGETAKGERAMTATVTIAPVRKSIRVNASQAHAFEVFTAGLGRWWPRNRGIGRMPMKAPVMETRLGGRWYELAEDGSQATVGRIIVWEPPQRFVMTWEINSQWKPDSTVSSEVEVRFIADGANATRVELEHRKFEQMGAEAGASMRKDVDGGWPGLLERFKTEAEAA